MAAPANLELTDEECVARIAAARPEVLVPGFWATLASNCGDWAKEISASPYWQQARKRLEEWRAEYRTQTGDDLISQTFLEDFVPKSEGRIREKLIHRIKRGKEDPAAAIQANGPPIPRLNDLVRTRVACRYIDGVEFLGGKLLGLADELQIENSIDKQGRIEGYFAQHVSIVLPVFYRVGGVPQSTQITCEIQLASDMATQMWKTAHPLYEDARLGPNEPEVWQWKSDDPRFISHQLGHMIHLADGLLVQLRELLRKKNL